MSRVPGVSNPVFLGGGGGNIAQDGTVTLLTFAERRKRGYRRVEKQNVNL